MIDYNLILSTNYGTSLWVLVGNTYEGLDWLDSTPKPTQAELDAAWTGVQTKLAKAITDKAAAKAELLTKLGITSDEAALLLS